MGRSGISMKLECWYFNLINYLKDNILNGLIVSSITGIVGCAIKKHKDKKQQQKIFYEQLNNTIKSIMDNTLETLFSGKNFLDIEEIIYELNQKVGTLFDSDIEADIAFDPDVLSMPRYDIEELKKKLAIAVEALRDIVERNDNIRTTEIAQKTLAKIKE